MEKIRQMKVYTKIITGDTETPVTIFKKYVGVTKSNVLEADLNEALK